MSIAAILLLAGPAHAVAGTSEYVLGPGDGIQVEVVGQNFGGKFIVGTDGTVPFPYCGKIQLGGFSLAHATDTIRTCLLDGVLVDPQVSVQVEEYRSQRVDVLGAVTKPGGIYLQDGSPTLRQVLGQAGGVQSEKSNGTIVINRGTERISVPVAQLELEGGSTIVLAGDVISVDEGLVVLVMGSVQKEGAFGFVEGMTVSQALARAGGASPVANLSAAYVLRDGQKLRVNLRKVRRGRAEDVVLQAGDQLHVPESPI
ncbi:MAG: polysaccharide biosynthesis/export family protein [Myxococcales bacterium]|nr:polysaccharide biosynthesis/export family protein [Myxococcales bacterium]